jgi:D-galactose 1-dehydrogenase
MNPIRVALVGMGKIAKDQHVPALAADKNFELVGVASRHNVLDGVPSFPSLDALLQGVPSVDAISICTPPQVRYDIARTALNHGRHVMLEKPPGATLGEVSALADLASRKGVSLFATWHSREASAVEPARQWLASRKIRSVVVTWKEDVRHWHPGQTWIWEAGGLGVFDPGINALSIVTRILPTAVVLKDAVLCFPSNQQTPIAASLSLIDENATPIRAEFDFRQTGPQSWDIEIETDSGWLMLSKGGAVMKVNDETVIEAKDREYPNLYAHFATLVRDKKSDVDVAPLRLVADAFLCGKRVEVEPFIE